MTEQPHWPPEEPGAEALFRRGERGEKGDQGEPGEPGMTHGAKRGFLISGFIIFLLAAAGALVAARAYNGVQQALAEQHKALTMQHHQTLRLCNEQADFGNLAAIPVTLNPATHQASKLGITIIADSRTAFRGLGCKGTLAKPGPSFIHWARFYKLPVT